ncbi:related to sulfate permease II [Phialocephala subalpina]|uniref:Related to sulfate permease II n=1 Tax=Phialocephala subalpina TaxID=576137 RepID=A0A1L7XYT3_9HELO|nr:related to sulfate permease II [Phialocephala subalpina]
MSLYRLATTVRKRVFHVGPDAGLNEKALLEKDAKSAIVAPYVEEEPSIKQWFLGMRPTRSGASNYIRSIFPFTTWITRYNLTWLLGDGSAGLTVGFVVVPQAMAYAILAELSPEYGLYTSFTGAALYWLFGTSKDIVIGTTAVGSLFIGGVIVTIENEHPGEYSAEEIAKCLTFLSGVILIFFGLFRLGWIIELIPYVPISAFVTSASITIIGTQFPIALGIQGINTRRAPYKVYSDTLKKLSDTQPDAAIGLTSILLLYVIREVCAKLEVRQPVKKKLWATISSLRLTFTILLYTFVSWLVHRTIPHDKSYWKFKLVGKIESGFKHAGTPSLDVDLIKLVTPELPAIIIILIIEHIAIAKSFGRRYGYTVIPSQEILAQGVSNAIGTLLGGYACTGSFGASAVLTKAGVRTPLAGLFSALVLILALYALTAVFYYIPKAALAGLIIHAVRNLMTAPSALYKYWQLSPLELLIWVYLYDHCALICSVAGPNGSAHGVFLGQIKAKRIVRSEEEEEKEKETASSDGDKTFSSDVPSSSTEAEGIVREAFLPMDKKDNSNPRVEVVMPYPGVFLYRFDEALNYINAARHIDHMLLYITAYTRRTTLDDHIPTKDRLWSDPIAKTSPSSTASSNKPLLRAFILDCSALNHLDITAIQSLVDVRNTLDRYVAPSVVEWHFSGLHNRWTHQALAVVGFGRPYSLAGATETDRRIAGARRKEVEERDEESRRGDGEIATARDDGDGVVVDREMDLEPKHESESSNKEEASETSGLEPVYGIDRPFFHIDLTDAVDTAVRDAKRKDLLLERASAAVAEESSSEAST